MLDIEPENAEAYVDKMLAEMEIEKREYLADCAETFEYNYNYKMAMSYADEELKNTLKGYIKTIEERKEQNRQEQIYQEGLRVMNTALTNEDFMKAVEIFTSILNYKDAKVLAEECGNAFEKRVIEANKIFESYRRLKKTPDEASKLELNEIKEKLCDIKIWSIIIRREENWSVFFDDSKFLPLLGREADILEKMPVKLRLKWEIEYGKSVVFGSIEWIVLEIKDNKALLLSKYTQGKYRPFHYKNRTVYWENCSLREWLNTDFFNSRFTDEEKKIICEVINQNEERNIWGSVIKGNNTLDRIFLLSQEEVEKYFKSAEDRYTYENMDKTEELHICAGWWLRSPAHWRGNGARIAKGKNAFAIENGSIDADYYVRPALWVDLSY